MKATLPLFTVILAKIILGESQTIIVSIIVCLQCAHACMHVYVCVCVMFFETIFFIF